METMTVGDFKTHFSEVLKKVIAGEEIAISYGKKKEIVARIVPKNAGKKTKRKIGLLDGKASIKIANSFKITSEEFLGL
ncbi:MAG: hypothetical protein Q8K64_05975 [Sediminibacterium sp.]|nr:hypothetical protein [Sediminibacterium sp.]